LREKLESKNSSDSERMRIDGNLKLRKKVELREIGEPRKD